MGIADSVIAVIILWDLYTLFHMSLDISHRCKLRVGGIRLHCIYSRNSFLHCIFIRQDIHHLLRNVPHKYRPCKNTNQGRKLQHRDRFVYISSSRSDTYEFGLPAKMIIEIVWLITIIQKVIKNVMIDEKRLHMSEWTPDSHVQVLSAYEYHFFQLFW